LEPDKLSSRGSNEWDHALTLRVVPFVLGSGQVWEIKNKNAAQCDITASNVESLLTTISEKKPVATQHPSQETVTAVVQALRRAMVLMEVSGHLKSFVCGAVGKDCGFVVHLRLHEYGMPGSASATSAYEYVIKLARVTHEVANAVWLARETRARHDGLGAILTPCGVALHGALAKLGVNSFYTRVHRVRHPGKDHVFWVTLPRTFRGSRATQKKGGIGVSSSTHDASLTLKVMLNAQHHGRADHALKKVAASSPSFYALGSVVWELHEQKQPSWAVKWYNAPFKMPVFPSKACTNTTDHSGGGAAAQAPANKENRESKNKKVAASASTARYWLWPAVPKASGGVVVMRPGCPLLTFSPASRLFTSKQYHIGIVSTGVFQTLRWTHKAGLVHTDVRAPNCVVFAKKFDKRGRGRAAWESRVIVVPAAAAAAAAAATAESSSQSDTAASCLSGAEHKQQSANENVSVQLIDFECAKDTLDDNNEEKEVTFPISTKGGQFKQRSMNLKLTTDPRAHCYTAHYTKADDFEMAARVMAFCMNQFYP
jgi:hypothetical protein